LIFLASQYCRRAFVAAQTLGLAAGLSSALPLAVRAESAASPFLNRSAQPSEKKESPSQTQPTDAQNPPAAPENNEESILVPFPEEESTETPPAPRLQRPPGAPPPPGRIEVRKFRQLRWSPGGRHFRSQGSVQIFYRDPTNPQDKGTTLTASDVEADADTGQVEARGGARLERTEGVITGDQIQYNFYSHVGYITNAVAETAYFRMRGKRIATQADGSYVVEEGVFTTCIRAHPDYQIRARRLTISPNRYVAARNITFYAGPTPLISLPSLRRDLARQEHAPVPTPGYSKSEGVTLRLHDTPIVQPHQTLDYEIRANLRRLPSGFLLYQSDLTRDVRTALPPTGLLPTLQDPLRGYLEQLSPQTYQEYPASQYQETLEPRATFFATLQAKQPVYNRVRTDLLVSRFPEVGVRFTNILGRRQPPPPTGFAGEAQTPASPPAESPAVALLRVPGAPFLLDVTASLGELHETPTGITNGRFSLRADAATQPMRLGRNLVWRAGLTNWFNLYGRGSAYDLLSPEVELDYLPSRTTLLGLAYRYALDAGSTPFAFDRLDVRQELRLRAQAGSLWAFGIQTKYDLERARAYDTELALVRNFDCMQIGVAYRFRSQSLSIIFNLLPATPHRERPLLSQ